MIDKPVFTIVAADKKNGIGKDGQLPWKLKKDMEFFKYTTMEANDFEKKNMVVMGRKTWESIPEKYRPLEDRVNVILTHNRDYKAEGATVVYSLGEALKKAELDEGIDMVFIIGGAELFKLSLPISDGLYLTRIDKEYDCDTFFPDFAEDYAKTPENLGSEEEDGVKYTFYLYNRDKTMDL